MSENIQQELDMFQKQRTNELRAMMIAYAKIHIKYCEEVGIYYYCYYQFEKKRVYNLKLTMILFKQNVISWKDARRYVDTIKPE